MPIRSPTKSSVAHARHSYLEPFPPLPTNTNALIAVPSNDTAPLHPEWTCSLAANSIEAFDFGFSSSPDFDSFGTTCALSSPSQDVFSTQNQFGPFNALPSTEMGEFNPTGLGITCDPALLSNHIIAPRSCTLPSTVYRVNKIGSEPQYFTNQPQGLPSTPHHRARAHYRSLSPSSPATEPSNSRTFRRTPSSKRNSKLRRTKSTNSTPRRCQNSDKDAFVNYTAEDSNKILSGVAPSGSSKTKARREKEAADKRRRLSQAAVKAIVEAGGDIDALDKAGFFI